MGHSVLVFMLTFCYDDYCRDNSQLDSGCLVHGNSCQDAVLLIACMTESSVCRPIGVIFTARCLNN